MFYNLSNAALENIRRNNYDTWRKAIKIKKRIQDKQINIAVSLSGLTKQDYITSKLLDRTINVKASCKVHRAVYDRLTEVLAQLQRINTGEMVDEELMENISLITRLVDGLYITK